jgi:FMN phosphatase YigB (HAD superfamily)
VRALDTAPSACLVADDRLDNLETAGALGMRTLLVGAETVPDGARIDAAVRTILELPRALEALPT